MLVTNYMRPVFTLCKEMTVIMYQQQLISVYLLHLFFACEYTSSLMLSIKFLELKN